MKERNSRYLMTEESFSAIARRPSGSVIALQLNMKEEDARQEVSKSLKAAFSRAKRKCCIKSGDGDAAFMTRRAGAATHLWVTVL
ncbi:hypothetical protein [Pantoea sp. EKM20T]|uniref:hypothetical protein n=1 Tax=Pantoea sp. EKM20T TaxID=2708059 RepID=UPI00142DA5D0|nr:hypothetical protein [Pantoea sp. EKM20T]KAF6677120.1 hypothetical protein HFD94_19675 [Pantoea sp. EKM20T]